MKCDRLRVHKNFMVSLIIRYVVSVIYYEPYIYGDPKAYVWYRGYVSLKKKLKEFTKKPLQKDAYTIW